MNQWRFMSALRLRGKFLERLDESLEAKCHDQIALSQEHLMTQRIRSSSGHCHQTNPLNIAY